MLAQLLAEGGELLQLAAVLLQLSRAGAAHAGLGQRVAAQQTARQRTPWNYAEAQLLRSRQYLKLRRPLKQVVQMLLGD
ncbi:hypothetical protein D3C73_1422960 [compost metagenome]